MLSNKAIPLTIGTVTSCGITKEKFWFPKDVFDVHTTPVLRVKVSGFVENPVVSTKNEIFAFAAERECGTYPIFLAKDTVFSLDDNLSRG